MINEIGNTMIVSCRVLFILSGIILFSTKIYSQKTITIDEVNKIVLTKSNHIKLIENEFFKSSVEMDLYKISLLPQISTSVSAPYQRSISEVLQSDGSLRYIERNFLNSSLNLNVSQVLPFTGGSINLTSSLNNARDFNNKTSSFSSNWVNLSYQQTINGFNSYRWRKKINSLTNKKDSIDNLKEKIRLKYEVSKSYLDTQLVQLKIDLFAANIQKTEKIIVELEEKLKYGRTLKIEVEQSKIVLEQLKTQQKITELDYLSGINSLKNMMNDKSDLSFSLLPVKKQNDYKLDKNQLKQAIRKNGFDLENTIKLLEGDASIDKAKKEGAMSINFQLGMGLNSSATNFYSLYEKPSQSQFVTIGTRIPILDWGKSKKNEVLARLEKENTELTIDEKEEKIDEQLNDLINYKFSLTEKVASLERQLALIKSIDIMFEELFKLGRKTTAEYKSQLVESFNAAIEYQKTINDLYLLKLKTDEIYLIF